MDASVAKRKLGFLKKPTSIIGIVLFFAIILIFAFYFLFIPKLTLIGDEYVKVVYGNKYEESGCHATYFGKDLSDKVWYEGNIDLSTLGDYIVYCKIKKNGMVVTKSRKVSIVDETEPTIRLVGDDEVTICPNTIYEEDGYVATDDYDGDITDSVVVETSYDSIKYEVSDSSGNKSEAIRVLKKVDEVVPVINLNGNSNYSIMQGSSFKDPMYTAYDNCDGDLSNKVEVIGNVDTSKVGNYEIIYKVYDSSQNETIVKRIVNVYKKVDTSPLVPGTIYLTFDDGPSSSITPKLLDILKEKNVKATFFVINHAESLDYLIQREYNEGHTVAIHSYTHDYKTIYSSVDAYFNDLNLMRDKVERLTGVQSNIIRFPGGSSNTISKHYSIGIMSTLTQEVLNRGYHYFDWNVSSGDAGEVKTKEGVYNNVINGLSKNKANIVLMHDFENNYKTLNAISDIIDYAKQNGYDFKTIDLSTPMVRHKVNN